MDKTKKQQDLEDYNHATSGLNVGRNHGFATPEHATAERVDSDNADATFDIAFAMLMEAEEQRRIAFEQQLSDLKDRYAELDRASMAALIEAEENLKDIQERANRSIDGRRIYLSEEDGQVYDEQGNTITREEIDPNAWDANAPSWQTWRESTLELSSAREFRTKVLQNQERLSDPDLTADDVDDLSRDTEALMESMPPSVAAHYEADQTAPSPTSNADRKGSLSSTVFFDINAFPFRAFVEEDDWLRVA